MSNRLLAFSLLICIVPFMSLPVQAEVVEYELTIAETTVNITGKAVKGMTINGNIPGPTLRFREGDTARIHVRNEMDRDTSIHWHGLLVPNSMDGVPYVTFPPIKRGTVFTYEFPIRQSGTYWYHSHTNLQEQRGVYGAFIIEPPLKKEEPDHDYVVVLSDWTDEDPYDVLRTLKRGSEWYAIEKGSGQSILGASKLSMLGDYMKRELQRMPAMDIADVAYDRFLANGRPEIHMNAEPGETVRLRVIDGSATTYFYLEFAGGAMTIVAADGQDTEPFQENRFLMAVAETYDVLLRMPDQEGAYEFRATAHDGSAFASVWIGSGKRHSAPEIPKPNLYHTMGALRADTVFALTPAGTMGMPDSKVRDGEFDRPSTMGMSPMGTDHEHHVAQEDNETKGHHPIKTHEMTYPSEKRGDPEDHVMPHSIEDPALKRPENRGSHKDVREHSDPSGKKYSRDFRPLASDVSASPELAVDGMDPRRPWPPYAKLRSRKPTVFDKEQPIRTLRLTLDGDMERYVWFLNNKALSETDSILIKAGEVVRFIMINRTMMHHPMHLHGHFFRVINGQGDYSPLKHTVDVAPMSTTVIEFDADEFGDWFFHCHLLYHMKSGMARVIHYEDFTLDADLAVVRPRLYKDPWYFWGEADVLTQMTEGFFRVSNTRHILNAYWEVGWGKVDESEWEGIFTWDRYMNRFFSIFAGANLEGVRDDIDTKRAVLGIRYLLPFNFDTSLWLDSDGGGRIHLDKHFQITPRLSLYGDIHYDTHDAWEGRVGLSYLINGVLSLALQWHSDYAMGGGIRLRF